jgi:DNA primase
MNIQTKTMKMNSNEVERAKSVPIVSFLASLGYEPCKQVGSELVYRSPLRNESTPSFFVNPVRNCFKDFGEESHKGDIVTLAALLWKTDFRTTVSRLLNLCSLPDSFSFSGSNVKEGQSSAIEIISVHKLKNPALKQYVRSRGISLELAESYLHEVAYQTRGRQFFAVGFKNDNGGYELRNGLGFKGGKTKNGISTLDLGTESVALFEGFFDFLSAMEYYGREKPIYTTIVLNTCNNLNRTLPMLANRKAIHCFLDNDETGRKTLQRLKNGGFPIKDWSVELYPNRKDFNDFLIGSRKGAVLNS